MTDNDTSFTPDTSIFVVSGGAGASGDLLLHTLLAQFPDIRSVVNVYPNTYRIEQIDAIVAQAIARQALIVHTLVDHDLRLYLHETARLHNIAEVDLVGELLEQLSHHLNTKPLGQPGRYRSFRNSYFKRIEAIEYTVQHDDGQRPHELSQAEIVVIGVSRVGKTPLSIYLSLEGWKVANLPLIPTIRLPSEFNNIEPSRVVGLTIAPAQLLRFRRSRQQHLGISEGNYFDLRAIGEEVSAANHLFSQLGCTVIDVTDKPIEATSEEVIDAVTIRLRHSNFSYQE
jgi:regulator of PEP synthase PpsR (kinase-PPPase family)